MKNANQEDQNYHLIRRAEMSGIRDEIVSISIGEIIAPKNNYTDFEFQINSKDKEGNMYYGRICGTASTEQQAKQLQSDIKFTQSVVLS